MADVAVSPCAPSLWRNRSFHLLWVCAFAAGVGDRLIMSAALPMLGYAGEDSNNAAIQAGVQFFFFLPYLLWSPFAGWLADRLPRKWLLLASDELRGFIVLYAFFILPPGVDLVPPDHQWKVWAVIGAVGMMAATFVPAKLSIVPNIVGLAELGRANAMVVSMGIIGSLMGFFIAGLMIEESVRVLIFTSALCYIVSGCFWFFVRTPWRQKVESGGGLAQVFFDIGYGLKYSWNHRPVRVLILTSAMVWTGVAVYMPALAVVNVEMYHRDASGLMFLMAPLGVGMFVSSALLAIFNFRFGVELLIVTGLLLSGTFIGLQMIVPVFGVGVAIALGTGLGAGMMLVAINTMIQRGTADYLRGRVFAAREMVQELGQVVVSYFIWKMGVKADPFMRPASGLLVGVLVGMAIYGIFRYACRGFSRYKIMNFLWRFARLYSQVMHRLKVVGKHHVPRTGPVLLVSNHTAGIDPTLIQSAIPRVVTWMMAKEYKVPGLNWFWKRYDPIYVDRNKADPQSARAAVQRLRDGAIIGLFPEGRINRDGTDLLPLSHGVAMIASRGGATLVPVHISGTPRTRRTFAAFFVPSRSRVTFGKPFKLTEEQAGDRAAAVELIAQKMREVAMGSKAAVCDNK